MLLHFRIVRCFRLAPFHNAWPTARHHHANILSKWDTPPPLFTHCVWPRTAIVEGDLLIIVGVEAVGPIQVDWGVCGLRYHHFALRARGVTPCDTSHDVAPTPDFSGSDDETKAQAPARGPYLMIRWTDGAEGGRDRPGRRRTGLEDAISGPILRFVMFFFGYKRNFEIRPSSQSREK